MRSIIYGLSSPLFGDSVVRRLSCDKVERRVRQASAFHQEEIGSGVLMSADRSLDSYETVEMVVADTESFPMSRVAFSFDRAIQALMNEAKVEEIKRHFGVVAEALRSDIRQVAEGHSSIRRELQEIRDEFRDEFREMRALMRLSFSQLDQRTRTLEPIFRH